MVLGFEFEEMDVYVVFRQKLDVVLRGWKVNPDDAGLIDSWR